jgi:hypothetical protein
MPVGARDERREAGTQLNSQSHRMARTWVIGLILALTACAGGGPQTVPASGDAPQRSVLGNGVNYGSNAIWAASANELVKYRADANGPTTPSASITGLGSPYGAPPSFGVLSLAIAPDGTRYTLAFTTERLGKITNTGVNVYAPGTRGDAPSPENVLGLSNVVGFALFGDAIDLARTIPPPPTAKVPVTTYSITSVPYPPATGVMRDFLVPGPVTDIASDANDNVYAAIGSSVYVYPAGTNGPSGIAPPARVVDVSGSLANVTSIAVGPGGSLYVAGYTTAALDSAAIAVFNRKNDGPRASRLIGPYPVSPAGSGITAMTISAKPELFVARQDQIYALDASATGPVPPLRTIPHATGGAIVSLAIGR